MKVLIACEESQRVCIEFRKRGHEAYSCDIMDCSGGHPEWHIKQDVIPILNGRCTFETMDGTLHGIDSKWDMIIAFPPCTKTSNAGARHLFKGGHLQMQRFYDGMCGKALFETIRHAESDKIVIENPTPSRIYEYPIPSQTIEPYQFGDPVKKRTHLWIIGVKLLHPTNIVECRNTYLPSGTSRKIKEAYGSCKRGNDSIERSKTFPGIAKAMAEQWG